MKAQNEEGRKRPRWGTRQQRECERMRGCYKCVAWKSERWNTKEKRKEERKPTGWVREGTAGSTARHPSPTDGSPYFIVAFADTNRQLRARSTNEDADDRYGKKRREPRTTFSLLIPADTNSRGYEVADRTSAAEVVPVPPPYRAPCRPGPSHPPCRGQTISQKSSPFPWKEKNHGDDSATATTTTTTTITSKSSVSLVIGHHH